ncbi:phage major capsid protein [bacterium]|nr:phage major capsid protein [bacterium]
MSETVKKAMGLEAGKLLFRSAALTRADGDAADLYDLSFSSEDPYERSFGIEILGHKPSEVRMAWLLSGHAPMLNQHDPKQQVGVVHKAVIEDLRGKAQVRFASGALAQELLKDVVNGVRGNVSVGYMVHDMVLEREEAGKPPVYRVTDWEPLEVSLVSIPADRTVGFGREQTQRERITMNETTPAPTAADERARVNDILTIGKTHKLDEMAAKAIADGKAVADFRADVLAKLAEGRKPVAAAADLGLTPKESKRYSLGNAIRCLMQNERVDASFERDCSDEIQKRVGRAPQGIYLPTDLGIWSNPTAQRVLQIGSTGTGANLVATELQPQNFIELLRNKMVTAKLGVVTLPNLVGDVAVPKQSAASTLYWVSEGTAVTESEQTFTQVTATPHTAGAATSITRKLLVQSTPSAEMLVRDDLLKVLAIGLDSATLTGTGSAGQPEGIFTKSGVSDITVTAGTPTYAEMLGFISTVAENNADIGSMAWALTPAVWAKLAATFQNASAGDTSILDWRSKTLLGLPYEVSMQVTAKYAFFGVWSQCVQALWNAPDLLVDPYTNSKSGTVIVRVLQDMDVMVRHEKAFAKADVLS